MLAFDLDGVLIPDCDNISTIGDVAEYYELAAANMRPLFQPGAASVIITARYKQHAASTMAWANRYLAPLPRRIYHDRAIETAAGYKAKVLNDDHTISVYVESDLEIVEQLVHTVRSSCKILHFSQWVATQLADEERRQTYMARVKTVTKLGDKLAKINESFTVHQYDNGYMFEASGRNKQGDYVTAKIMCSTMDEIALLLREAGDMDLDD